MLHRRRKKTTLASGLTILPCEVRVPARSEYLTSRPKLGCLMHCWFLHCGCRVSIMPATLVARCRPRVKCADQDAQGKIAVGGEATRPQNQRQEGECDGEQRGGAW